MLSVERDTTNRSLFHVLYEIRVENLGNVALTDVQLVDDLSQTFAGVGSWSVESLASGDLTVNPGFDGAGDTALLAAGNTLAVGASGTLTLQVLVDPAGMLMRIVEDVEGGVVPPLQGVIVSGNTLVPPAEFSGTLIQAPLDTVPFLFASCKTARSALNFCAIVFQVSPDWAV